MSESKPQWDHKDVWRRRGKDFMVEISRHSSGLSREYDSEGPNRWCVYAYIYPQHPQFAKFEGPQMWQDAANMLILHGGPSLLEYPMYEGRVTSVKVGCDYNHLHDDRFTHMATAEEARRVFDDADELFDQLTRLGEDALAKAGA